MATDEEPDRGKVEPLVSEQVSEIKCDSPQIDRVTAKRIRLLPLLAPWLRPVRWAPVVARTPLRLCFEIHLLGAIAAFLASMMMIDLDASASGRSYSAWGDFGSLWSPHPEIAAIVVGLCAGSIELCFLAAAFILTPWGAGDERLRSSYARALRHTWLLSTQAIPLILVIGLAAVPISAANREFFDTHPFPSLPTPTVPAYPAGAAPNSEAMRARQAAYAEYRKEIDSYHKRMQQAWRDWERSRPFLLRIAPNLMAFACVAASAWVLWSLLRAIGAPRGLPPISRPPTCEFCGYNLTGTAVDRRCPECGVPAIDSLGPEARPGTPIDRTSSRGWLSAWWKCGIEALRRPSRFGRLIQVNQQSRRYRWSLAPLLLVGAPLAAIAFVAVWWFQVKAFTELDSFWELETEIFTVAAPVMGISSAVGMAGVALLIAAVVGGILSWKNGRNLLPAAMQMQAHLGLFILLWTLFGCAWTIVTFVVDDRNVFRFWGKAFQIDDDPLRFLFWVVPVAPWLFLNVILLWKGVSAARHANK